MNANIQLLLTSDDDGIRCVEVWSQGIDGEEDRCMWRTSLDDILSACKYARQAAEAKGIRYNGSIVDALTF